MALSKKEYNEMMAYLTRPEDKKLKYAEPSPKALKKDRPYSELEILENYSSRTGEPLYGEDEIILEKMPSTEPEMDLYMPEITGTTVPIDLRDYRQMELADGGSPNMKEGLVNKEGFKYAKQIAKTPLGKILLAESGIGAVIGGPLDYVSGYSPKEIALNIPTIGMGTTVKDDIDMLKAVGPKNAKLLQQYAAQGSRRRYNNRKGIESILDKDMQKALDAKDDFFKKLQEKRDKVAERREKARQKRGKVSGTGLEEETFIPE
jgi:hypothetical protein